MAPGSVYSFIRIILPLVGGLFLISGLLFMQFRASSESSVQTAAATASVKTAWEILHPGKNDHKLSQYAPQVVKLILHAQNNEGEDVWLAAIKKSRRQKKDGLQEFPGGRVDAAEEPLQALRRELAEEDPGGSLLKALNDPRLPLYFQNITIKKRGRHTLFYKHLGWTELQQLLKGSNQSVQKVPEVWHFVLVSGPLPSRESVKDWTPRSRKIFRALRKGGLSLKPDA